MHGTMSKRGEMPLGTVVYAKAYMQISPEIASRSARDSRVEIISHPVHR